MEPKNLRVIVAGGGIGGLAAAVALGRRGHEVEVIERAPELRPVGAGLTVQINAMRALAKLGLAEKVAQAGQIVRTAEIRNWDGESISQMNLTALSEELGAPCVGIHRAELHKILLDALATPPRLGVTVTSFVEEKDQVVVKFSDGNSRTADLLIGADGLHSAVRAQLHQDGEPTYAGYTSWRGVCDNNGVTDPSTLIESWGDGSRFGLVPIGPGKMYWFAVADAPANERDGADVKKELLARFGSWHREVKAAIEATAAERIFRTDISDRPVLKTWGRGRVTLLGDAAHPMTPNLGQGACMALEDAVVLDSALGEKSDPEAALRLYEDRRRERANTTVEMARKFGRMGQWSNSVARAVRNAVVHATPAAIAEKQVRWLYDFNP